MMSETLKKIVFSLIIIITFAACQSNEEKQTWAKIKNIVVEDTKIIVKPNERQFAYPQKATDLAVYFTTSTHEGIYIYDFTAHKFDILNGDRIISFIQMEEFGALYYLNKKISRRVSKYNLMRVDLYSKKVEPILKTSQEIRNLQRVKSNQFAFVEDKKIKLYTLPDNLIKDNLEDGIAWDFDKDTLYVYDDEIRKFVFKEGKNIIWVDLNQQAKRFVVYVAGVGCYLFNPDFPKNVKLIGDFKNPKISPNSRFVLYYHDKYENHELLYSNLYVYDIFEGNNFVLLKDEWPNAFNPYWVGNDGEFVFNTSDGYILQSKLDFYYDE